MKRPDVGLCAECRHARVQRNARGSEFWRCLKAETDPGFERYPRLPVSECAGYERAARIEEVEAASPPRRRPRRASGRRVVE